MTHAGAAVDAAAAVAGIPGGGRVGIAERAGPVLLSRTLGRMASGKVEIGAKAELLAAGSGLSTCDVMRGLGRARGGGAGIGAGGATAFGFANAPGNGGGTNAGAGPGFTVGSSVVASAL